MQANGVMGHTIGAMGSTTKEYAMSDEQEKDSQGRKLPPIGEVYEKWLTVKQVKEQTTLQSDMGVIHAIKAGRIAGYKIGEKYRGEWRIDPTTITDYLPDGS